MLARDRVVLLERELLGLGAAVLARNVEISRIGSGEQLDLDVRSFGHDRYPSEKNDVRVSV